MITHAVGPGIPWVPGPGTGSHTSSTREHHFLTRLGNPRQSLATHNLLRRIPTRRSFKLSQTTGSGNPGRALLFENKQ
eukprot:3657244-Rhodomonas_salina.1